MLPSWGREGTPSLEAGGPGGSREAVSLSLTGAPLFPVHFMDSERKRRQKGINYAPWKEEGPWALTLTFLI